MRLLVAFVSLVVFLTLVGGRRIRPWVIGTSLVSCGFAVHAAFELWVSDFAGRTEMGGFAFVEGLLFVAGLALQAVSLVVPQPTTKRSVPRIVGCLLWLVTALVTGCAVLARLPS